MARFALLGAQECIVAGGMRRRLRAGTTIADSAGNAQAGDVISSQLAAAPNTRMVALDAGAVAAFLAVGIVATIGQQLGPLPTSADSIDA
jgi:hypothetical protein